MRRGFYLFVMFGLIISFQNCSKKGFVDNASNSNSDSPKENQIVQKQYDMSQASSLEFTSMSSVSLGATPGRGEGLEIVYNVDLLSGQISENSTTNQTKYCLSDKELNELRDILHSSAICAAKSNSNPDLVCTMEYRSPYAHVNFPSAQGVDLGEMYNGCESGPDLCGQQSEMLKGFISFVLKNLASHQCE